MGNVGKPLNPKHDYHTTKAHLGKPLNPKHDFQTTKGDLDY